MGQIRFSSRVRDGKTMLNRQDVPMAEVERLIKALQEGLDAQPTANRLPGV